MPLADKSLKKELDILWVGKFDFRKQLALAIRSVAATKNPLLKFHIVGGDNDTYYKKLAADLGIDSQCIWHGAVTHTEVQSIMQNADLFFFSSVAEGTPHVVLEAIANNLPVICFDTCGQGDSVNDKVGRKIPLSNPQQSIRDFARELNKLYSDRATLKSLSDNCRQRQAELSWDRKAERMVELYKSVLIKA
jgi:glycosyltransferase involved in cell wall biosynthesis